jgi:HSP20 family molecular chaperone IbpA
LRTGFTIKNLSEQLPACVFTRLLEVILTQHRVSELADATGCPPELIQEWSNGLTPDLEAKAKILTYAFLQCRETEEILTGYLEEIRRMLAKLKTSKRSEKLDQLIASVDDKSQLIINFFFRNRYAGIRRLADLIHADSDMEVLMRVREVINAKAQEILGFPLLNFERSKIDPLTGEKIVFSWWTADKLTGFEDNEILDVFNEEDRIRIVACLPQHLHDVEIEVRGNSLILSGGDYHREIPLLHSVEGEVEKTWNNGVLEVGLRILGPVKCQ